MKTQLEVFKGLPIPVEYAATMKYAVLAKSNGGKTFLTLKFEEQLCDAGAFFVTLDPVGKHWALRAGRDGSKTGGKRDVYVLGGLHGDVPLEPGSGALIADTVLDHPGRYVLDVSTFESDSDQDRFALDFAKRLFRRKAKDPGFPLLLILEEAESFIPQKPQPGQAAMLGAYGKIARQGRNHGLGLWMVSQRSAALNKGVLSQADVLIAKEMSHNRDRDAVDDWVESNGTKEQRNTLMASLASLSIDEAWVWSPSWLKCFDRVKVLPRVTFDSSANVKHGAAVQEVELTPLDVDALGKAIAATAERAKADDPRELRRRIAELERQRPPESKEVEREVIVPDKAAVDKMVALRDEMQLHTDELLDELEDAASKLAVKVEIVRDVRGEMSTLLAETTAVLDRVGTKPQRVETAPRQPEGGHVAVRAPVGRGTSSSAPPRPAVSSNGNGSGVKPAHRKLLNALASLEAIGVPQADKKQLALFAGVSPKSGAFFNNLGSLRTSGLLDYPSGGVVALTAVGRAEADAAAAPSSTVELHEHVRRIVKEAKWKIVEALIAVYPLPMVKADLAASIGVSPTSGAFYNNLGSLRSLGLIDYPSPGSAAATDILFLAGG